MPRQLSCRDMYKIMIWSDMYFSLKSSLIFSKMLIMSSYMFSEMGPSSFETADLEGMGLCYQSVDVTLQVVWSFNPLYAKSFYQAEISICIFYHFATLRWHSWTNISSRKSRTYLFSLIKTMVLKDRTRKDPENQKHDADLPRIFLNNKSNSHWWLNQCHFPRGLLWEQSKVIQEYITNFNHIKLTWQLY